jgi:hypothetical protein
VHILHYDTQIKAKTDNVSISAGEYHFESIRTAEADSGSDYENISATFSLLNDGRFSETIDTLQPPRDGDWQVTSGTLVLNYDDGTHVIYQKNAVYEGLELFNYYALNNGNIVNSGETYIIPAQSFNWQNSSGYLLEIQSALYNSELDGGFGFKFNTDLTGAQQSNSLGEWSEPNSGLHTWSLTDNLYKMNYYFDADIPSGTSQFIAFCDVSEDNCSQWRYRELKIIGQTNNHFIVKIYQEMHFPEEIQTTSFRGGYISLFKFSNL